MGGSRHPSEDRISLLDRESHAKARGALVSAITLFPERMSPYPIRLEENGTYGAVCPSLKANVT